MNALYDDAVETVLRSDLWHEPSWQFILRSAPLPTAEDVPLLHGAVPADALCRASTVADIAASLNRPVAELPTHPFAYVPLLFPTSPVVAVVATCYAKAGVGAVARKLLAAATKHAAPFPSVWLAYVGVLEQANAAPGALIKALRAALDEVGSDPRSGKLWVKLAELLLNDVRAKASAAPAEVAVVTAATEAVRSCVTAGLVQPIEGASAGPLRAALASAEEALARAGGPAARGLPVAIEETRKMAASLGDRELQFAPPERFFPQPLRQRGGSGDGSSSRELARYAIAPRSLWVRFQEIVRGRHANPLLMTDTLQLRRFVDLPLRQLACHASRTEGPFLLRALYLYSLGDAEAGADAAAAAVQFAAGKCLLVRRLAAETEGNVASLQKFADDVGAGKDKGEMAARMSAAESVLAGLPESEMKAGKKAFRSVGKAAVASQINDWELYAAWGSAELAILGDHALLNDIARRGLAVAEEAARKRTRGFAAANFTALCQVVAGWALHRRDELEHQGTLKRAVQVCGDSTIAAPAAIASEAWLALVDAEGDLRGPEAANDGLRRMLEASPGFEPDEDTEMRIQRGRASWGTARQRHQLRRVMRQCGGTSVLSPDEASLWQLLGDVETAAHLKPDERGSLAPLPSHRLAPHLPSPCAVAEPLCPRVNESGAACWQSLTKLPVNTHPPKDTEEQNSDDLCAPRAMKPMLKYYVDPSVQLMRVWGNQISANPDAELLAPAGAAKGTGVVDADAADAAGAAADGSTAPQRLAPQLQELLQVCRGLPSLAAGAMDVSPDWMIKTLTDAPLELRYDEAADMARRKAHRREMARVAEQQRSGRVATM